MTRKVVRPIHVGPYAAEVEVELLPDDGAWGPYLSMEDALKLDRVKRALESNDLQRARQDARVFTLTPIPA